MGTYNAVARRLVDRCREYRDGQLSLSELKAWISGTAEQIVAVEERDVREFLDRAEGKLDILEHTTDTDDVFAATVPLVVEVERALAEYLSPTDRG